MGHGHRVDRRQRLAHFVGATIAHYQVTRRFRQPEQQDHGENQRQHPADQQQAVPAERRNQLGGNEPATGHAEVEATEHAGHQQGFLALRGVFREQRGGVRHPRAQAETGQETQHQQLFDIGAVSRGQAESAEQQHGANQHHFAPEAVSQRAGTQGTEDHADQRGAHYRAEAGAVDAPVLRQRRGDEAHGGGVEAVEKDNQETQDHHSPLIARDRLGIDEGLHVEAVTHSGLRLVHYFYSTQKTQSNDGRPTGSTVMRIEGLNQASRCIRQQSRQGGQSENMRMVRCLLSLLSESAVRADSAGQRRMTLPRH